MDPLMPLSPETVADALISAATSAEPGVTSTIEDIIKENGGYLNGLDHRLKTHESLQAKLNSYTSHEGGASSMFPCLGGSSQGSTSSIEDVHKANCISPSIEHKRLLVTDVLRYTAVFPEDTYSSAVASVRAACEWKGLTKHEQKNFWPRSASGEGRNMSFRGIIDTMVKPTALLPSGRLLVEVQFMTEASLRHSAAIHDLYTVFRGAPKLEQRVHAHALMLRKAEGISIPAGADELPKNLFRQRIALTKARLASIPSRMEPLSDAVQQSLGAHPFSTEELERLVPDYDNEDVKAGRHRRLDLLMMLAALHSPVYALKTLFAAPTI